MKIIDASYFSKAPWVIANAVDYPKSAMQLAACKVIEEIIESHQDKFLRDVLGTTEISEEDAEDLKEPFGAYIYFHILRHAESVKGITGVYQLVSSDKSVSPRHIQMQAWNTMVGSLKALSLEKGWNVACNLLTPVNIFNI